MLKYRFNADGTTVERAHAPIDKSIVFNTSDRALAEASLAVLKENNPVGIAVGFYDEKLTIELTSWIFADDLGYDSDTFMERINGSLLQLMVNAPLFPFSYEKFRNMNGSGCFYMEDASGRPRVMYVVKHNVTGADGKLRWVMSARNDRNSQNLTLVNEFCNNAYWSMDYDGKGRISDMRWSLRLCEILKTDLTAVSRERKVRFFEELVHPEDRLRVHKLFAHMIPSGNCGDSVDMEFRLRIDSGFEWFRSSVHLVRRADGSVCQVAGVICNINEEKLNAERELRHETFLKAFADGNLCEFFVDLKQATFERFTVSEKLSAAAADTADWGCLVAGLAKNAVMPESREAFVNLLDVEYLQNNLKMDGGGLSGEFRIMLGGKPGWARCMVLSANADETGQPRHTLVYLRDITVSKLREAERNRLSREKAELDQLVDGVTRMVKRFAVCDLDAHTYSYHSMEDDKLYQPVGRYEDLTHHMDEMLQPLDENHSKPMSEHLALGTLRSLLKKQSDVYRFEYCTRDKKDFLVMSVVPLAWRDGVVTKVMLVSEDSSQKHALEVMANTDALTGLYNARNLTTVMHQLRGRPFTLFYLDLDGFKIVNDTHGHAVGDQLLQVIALRLKKAMREEDLVFRVGGDEFCIVVYGTLTEKDRQQIEARVKEAVAQSCNLGAVTVTVSTSCGCACCPGDTDSPEEARILADHRMYLDKEFTHEKELARDLAGQ